ncbi:MAG: caspase family protein [Gemmataceae bacterium]
MRQLAFLALLCAAAAAPAGKHALVVGVNQYKDASLSKLDFAVNDATALAAALREAGFDTVRTLVTGGKKKGERPNAATIREAVRTLAAGRGKDDLLLVTLAGHGVRLVVEDPIRPGEGKAFCYFCPLDARLTGVKSGGETPHLINLATLVDDLGKSDARHRLILVDACRNQVTVKGITARAGTTPGVPYSLDPRQVVLPRGVGALYSCSPGEVAYEAGDLGGKGHGIFFHFVLEGLRGRARNRDDEVTWGSLGDYVSTQVQRQVPAMVGAGVKQSPHLVTNLTGGSPVLVPARAGDQRQTDRLYRRGMDAYLGRGVKIDQAGGVKLLEEAADKGHHLARGWHAWYQLAASRVPTSLPKARQALAEVLPEVRKLVARGDPESQLLLGWMYGSGEGLTRDDKEAAFWYRRAAESNGSQAQYQLGLLYESGTLVAKDEKEAARWFRRAAVQDLAFAQHALAGTLERAAPAEAASWYQKAAAADHVGAQFRLAGLYAEGRGVAKDEKKAVEWFRKAADGGHPQARAILRRLGG